MAHNGEINVGDTVIISFDPRDICAVPGMFKYNGLETTISKVHSSRYFGAKQYRRQYECDGVESIFGIPFIFTRDMLISEKDGLHDKRS